MTDLDEVEPELYANVRHEISYFAEQLVPEDVDFSALTFAYHFWFITDAAGLDPRQVVHELEDVTLRYDRHRAAVDELREVVARHEVEREEAEEKLRLTPAA